MVTVSSKGQISIPSEIRSEMNLERGSKLLVVTKGDNILLRRIDASVVEESLEDVLREMWETSEEKGASDIDVEDLVHETRGVED